MFPKNWNLSYLPSITGRIFCVPTDEPVHFEKLQRRNKSDISSLLNAWNHYALEANDKFVANHYDIIFRFHRSITSRHVQQLSPSKAHLEEMWCLFIWTSSRELFTPFVLVACVLLCLKLIEITSLVQSTCHFILTAIWSAKSATLTTLYVLMSDF